MTTVSGGVGHSTCCDYMGLEKSLKGNDSSPCLCTGGLMLSACRVRLLEQVHTWSVYFKSQYYIYVDMLSHMNMYTYIYLHSVFDFS